MSLMHLLTVSRSFKGVQDRPGNYKMEPDHSLPKFESAAPAISLTPARKAPAVSAPRQESLFSELVAGPALKTNSATAPVPQTPAKPAPPLEKTFSSMTPAKPVVHPHLSGPLFEKKSKGTAWKTMLKELFFGRKRRRSNVTNVQTELALNNVTVVRNDLRDADIEFINPRPHPLSEAHSTTSSRRVVPPHKFARDWVKLTKGLIRPQKSAFSPSQGVASAAEQNRTPDLIARR